MSQFYTDAIEKEIFELEKKLTEKDSELNIFIGKLTREYIYNDLVINQSDFNKEFDGIYQFEKKEVTELTKSILITASGVNNANDLLAFLERGDYSEIEIELKKQELKGNLQFKYLVEYIVTFFNKLKSLKLRSYQKYLEALNEVNSFAYSLLQ